MKSKSFAPESASILVAVISVYVIMNTFLINYSSYLLALLVVFSAIYISIKKRSKTASELFTGSVAEIFALITITLLMVMLTGGLASPLFFFLFFILFFLAFLCNPVSIWTFLVLILLFFAREASNNISSEIFIRIGSMLLIAPIAFFVSKELQRREKLSTRIESKTDEIIHEARILRETNNNPDGNEVIEEIIEEAESLKRDNKS